MKALALAALFLAMATLGALVLPGYLRHRRVVHTEQPIGVPVGVPDAFASATPATANTVNAVASNATQPTPALADSNSSQSAPAKSAASNNSLTSATDSPESAATNEVAVARTPSTTLDSPPNQQAQEPVPVTANNATTLPASTDSPEVAIMREVRRPKPVEPEVRRAEPAPPEQGSADLASHTTTSSSQETKSVAKSAPNREVEADTPETTSLALKRTDSNPEVASKSHDKKTEQPAKPKRRSDEKIYLLPGREFEAPTGRLPRGSVRGRFMGVTADGRWMFELPSHEIVIVPPPPSSP
jgi:hypothetical protein